MLDYKDITRENVSEVLVEYIAEKKILQSEIARKSGLTENTISLLVNGARPQATTVYKLKKYFKSIGQK
jgi:plasmid maintenance system antidote protein VapI